VASGAKRWGQTRCRIYRSGMFNVQRSTLNVQWSDRKGGWWAEYGDRHKVWTTGLLTRWTWPSAGRKVQAGCGAQIRGQTRCPVCRSGTFNVQRSTLNFQRGDRKDAWWPGYMGTDTVFCRSAVQIEGQTRYLARAARLLTRRTRPSAGRKVQAGCGAQIRGQTRCPVCRSGTFNVQR
jgi:hypothetical protein